jgi:sugar phosphate permease
MLIIVLPLSLIVRHKPEYYGYQPDGEIASATEVTEKKIIEIDTEVNTSAKQAIKSRAFCHIAIASTCHSFVINAIVTHMMPYLSSVGIVRSVYSLIALLLPVSTVIGRLGSGWLSDKLGGRKVFVTSFALMTA